MALPPDVIRKSLPAFNQHIDELARVYGGPIHALAFLRKGGGGVLSAEATLLQAFKALTTEARHHSAAGILTLDSLDITAKNLETLPRGIDAMIRPYVQQMQFSEVSGVVDDGSASLRNEQCGVFRVNCREYVSFCRAFGKRIS